MDVNEDISKLEDVDIFALQKDLYDRLQEENYFSNEYKELVKFYNKVCKETFKRNN